MTWHDADLIAHTPGRLGVTTRGALYALGVSRYTVNRRVQARRWSEPAANVIALPGPEDFRRSVLVCCLACGPGAAASHETAAHLHGLLDSPRPHQVTVTLPWSERGRARGPGEVVRSRHLAGEDVRIVRGVPLTSVAWTLDDVTRLRGARDGAFVVGDALRRGLVRRGALLDVAGRRPRSPLPDLLHDVLRGEIERAESPAEVQAVVLLLPELRRRGLPEPVLQYEVRDRDGQFVARVDAGWPPQQVALEVNSDTYHATRSAQARDRRRADDLGGCDWRVVFASPAEIRQRPAEVVDRIALELAAADALA
jgi:hypothetical protein